MKYVIIGAGPAGSVAADTLRAADPGSSVTIIGEENAPPYSRMAIPYYLVGNIDETGTYLKKQDGYYETNNIELVRSRVTGISPKDKSVSLADGSTRPYDKLLIATGARPVKPPIEGLDQPGVHHCWTLEDARNIIDLAQEGSHVVLLGAGFIGCIILEALAERGVDLTVVEMGERMVPRMMNETAGGLLQKWCENKGVKVFCNTKITQLEPNKDSSDTIQVDMDNGKSVPAHLVVIAAGVTSNIDFLEGSGIKTEQGILVDESMQTSLPDIYAAGDVAQGPDFFGGGKAVHAIQPTAADHGRVAALNMAGQNSVYQGSLIMNVLDTLGLITASFGQWEGVPGGEQAENLDADNYRYINLQFDKDILVGAITAGRTDMVGVLRGLIQSKVSLGPWKAALMEDPHRIAEAYVDRKGA